MADLPFRLLDQMSGHQLLDLAEDLGRIITPDMTAVQLLRELSMRGFGALQEEKESRVQRAPDTAVSL